MTDGSLSEWRATLLVRETSCLSREDRSRVDARLCADPAILAGLGDRAIGEAARRAAYRLDPQAAVDRAKRAESERRVSRGPRPTPELPHRPPARLPRRRHLRGTPSRPPTRPAPPATPAAGAR